MSKEGLLLLLGFIPMRQMDFRATCCLLDHDNGDTFYYEHIEPYFDNWLTEKTPIVEVYTYDKVQKEVQFYPSRAQLYRMSLDVLGEHRLVKVWYAIE